MNMLFNFSESHLPPLRNENTAAHSLVWLCVPWLAEVKTPYNSGHAVNMKRQHWCCIDFRVRLGLCRELNRFLWFIKCPLSDNHLIKRHLLIY